MSASLWPLSGDWGQREETAGMMGQWEESRRVLGLLSPPIKSAPPSLVSLIPEEGIEVATPIINQFISNFGLGSPQLQGREVWPHWTEFKPNSGRSSPQPHLCFLSCTPCSLNPSNSVLSHPSLSPRIPRGSQAATCFLAPSEWVL